MAPLHIFFEHASGFGLFKVTEFEEIGAFIPQVEAAVSDVAKFQRIVKLIGFKPFTSAASALQNINAISEGLLTSEMSAFLETNLPSIGKKSSKVQLGVVDVKLAASINEAYGVSVTHVGVVPEIVRGIRQHLTSYVKGLSPASMKQTELGLGHAYSRAKVKFNVNRIDNMIIQSISIIDQLDKDINTFAMRMKEWYSYHFPELAKVVTDNYQYSLCTNAIKDRKNLNESSLGMLEEIVMDPNKAQAILDASRMSMGMDISPIDLMNIERFAKRLISLSAYRQQLGDYLRSKMSMVAPNLACLIGEVVGARLISHSGSLTNLAKYPASTVQILGAEKALFRAIKTHSATPKYGLIYHASFISRAGPTNKGRISRYLANKCSLACRIDCFSENLTPIFGQKLRGQVEERLKFYESGEIPRKNLEVMSEALSEHKQILQLEKKKAKKRKREELLNGTAEEMAVTETGEEPKKKKKKKKPLEQERDPMEEVAAAIGQVEAVESSPEKKKKKKKKAAEEQVAFNGEETIAKGPEEKATPKKKKKKSLQPGELNMVNVSLDQGTLEEPVQLTGDGSSKKKKKKKSIQPEETMNVNGDLEGLNESSLSVGSPKKKKKKKSLQPGELSNIFLDVTGDMMADGQGTNEELVKKKKKKKKSLEVAE